MNADRLVASLTIVVIVFVLAVIAFAAPPPDAEPDFSAWFGSLHDKSGASCCNLADCRASEYRPTRTGIEARTPDGQWVAVPNDTVLTRTDNPTGFGVLCWNGSRVMCFVRASES